MAEASSIAPGPSIKADKKQKKDKKEKKDKKWKSGSEVEAAEPAVNAASPAAPAIFGGGSVDPALNDLFAASVSRT